jgi:hypothetical protein
MLRPPRSPRFSSRSQAGGRVDRTSSAFRLAGIALFAGLLLGQLSASNATAAEAGVTSAPGELGDRLHQRFRVWIEDETIRLRPLEDDSAIRSIELADGESEASVNGKAFTADELRAFLGKDGELIADLAALDGEARRVALGLAEPEATEADGIPAPPDPDGPPSPPEPPQIRVESDNDDRVSFGRSIEVAAGESAGSAVCIGCSITVGGDVEGDAVSVGGSIRLESGARVRGNSVSVGGKVELESGATVEGDAVAVGGVVKVADGATVEGQKSTVGWGDGISGRGHDDWQFGWPFLFDSDFGDFFWSLVRTLFLILLCCLSVLLARGSVDRTSRRLTDEPWKAIFAGLLTQLLFFPVLIFVTVILAVSIIGIPLLVLVPVAVLALLVATLLGFAAVAQSLGRWAADRFAWRLTEPFLPVVVGVAMIQGITVVGKFLGLPGGVFGLFAFALVSLGFFVKYVAWTMGLGAMTLSLLGRDWRRPDSTPVGYAPAVPSGAPMPSSLSSETPPPPPQDRVAEAPFDADTDAGWGQTAESEETRPGASRDAKPEV